MIEDYTILIAKTVRELGQIVRHQIKEGWIPQGAPFTASVDRDWDMWYQAMIKYKSNGDVPTEGIKAPEMSNY